MKAKSYIRIDATIIFASLSILILVLIAIKK